MYLNVSGVARSNEIAHSLLEKGCNLKDGMACANLAFMYEQGISVTHDLAKAKQLYQKGCDLDSSEACDQLAALSGQNQNANQTPKAKSDTYEQYVRKMETELDTLRKFVLEATQARNVLNL